VDIVWITRRNETRIFSLFSAPPGGVKNRCILGQIENRKEKKMDIRQKLFEAMRNDLTVMAEHNDSEQSLLEELNAADPEIIAVYAETFLDI
jgi:hypothetical protein